jgi:hypothetical protein
MHPIAIIVVASLIAISSSSVSAQPSNSPANNMNCNDFTKQGPDKWFADGEVHLKIDGIAITYNNTTIVPGMKTPPVLTSTHFWKACVADIRSPVAPGLLRAEPQVAKRAFRSAWNGSTRP